MDGYRNPEVNVFSWFGGDPSGISPQRHKGTEGELSIKQAAWRNWRSPSAIKMTPLIPIPIFLPVFSVPLGLLVSGVKSLLVPYRAQAAASSGHRCALMRMPKS